MAVFLNGFNIGTDLSATVTNDFGDNFTLEALGLLTEFEVESLDKELEVMPISQGGVPVFQTVWSGWRGRLGFARADFSLQQMAIDMQDAYFNNGVITQFSMFVSVLNRNGSIDEYQLTGVQFSKPKPGNFRAEKEVDMTMEFKASRMSGTGPAGAFLQGLAAA